MQVCCTWVPYRLRDSLCLPCKLMRVGSNSNQLGACAVHVSDSMAPRCQSCLEGTGRFTAGEAGDMCKFVALGFLTASVTVCACPANSCELVRIPANWVHLPSMCRTARLHGARAAWKGRVDSLRGKLETCASLLHLGSLPPP